jgi:hypothetical protein
VGAAAAAAIPEHDRKNNRMYVWGQNTEVSHHFTERSLFNIQ